jgi:mannose-6-phosphate isomerase-like protein (cupin superfamily)
MPTSKLHYSAAESDEYWFEEGCFIKEQLNDPDHPQLSVVQARVPTEGITAWHCLKDTEERYVILEGEGIAEVGEEAFEVSIGDVVVIPAGVAQRIKNTGSNDLRFLAICHPRFLVENYMRCTPPK